MLQLKLTLILAIVSSIHCLKLLFVAPCQSGHLFPAAGVARALLSQGHRVDLFLGDDCCEKAERLFGNVPRCTSVPVILVGSVITKGPLEVLTLPTPAVLFANNGTVETFNHVNKYLDQHHDYDVVVHDFILTGAQIAASVWKVAAVTIYSGPLILPVVGEPFERWSYLYFPESKFPKIVLDILDAASLFVNYQMISKPVSRAIVKLQKENNIKPSWQEKKIEFSLPLSFYYYNSIITHIGPPDLTLPNTKYAGIYNNIYHVGFVPDQKYLNPLTRDLENFISNSTVPVVYMSLGTFFQLPEQELKRILPELAGQTKLSIIWSAPRQFHEALKNQGVKSENLLLVTKIPQLTLLRHEKVKVFITHAGSNSMQEGVFAEIPMLVFPRFGDQLINARRLVNKNVALPLKELSFAEISRKIDTMLHPGTYERMKADLKASRVEMETLGGFKTAAEVVEKVGRREIRVGIPPELYNVVENEFLTLYLVGGFICALLATFIGAILYFVYRKSSNAKSKKE